MNTFSSQVSRRLVSLAVVLMAMFSCGAEPAAQSPAAEVVAPGVWRIRFGQPEKFTPTFFRSAPMAAAGLQALAAKAPLPLDPNKISFQVSGRGCSILLPMENRESIYGFGLHTRIFDATRLGGVGQPGRRMFVEPTDAPENDLGQSHAPVPFYVSSRGYGVFVDTARFASFYTGSIAPAQDAAETEAGGTQTSTTELYRAREPRVKTMVAGIRGLLQLRMSFIPYLYAAFNKYRVTGKPPIRALVLDWPDDAKVWAIDDQFMFGDSVMVAPMFAGQKKREVYLPAGDWYDFWTHAKLGGGRTIEAANDVPQIPLFLKGGTLLPLAAPVEYIKDDTCFDLTVYSVGDQPADFTLYEDDGVSSAYANGKQNTLRLRADGDQHSAVRSGNYSGPERFKITDWKKF